MLAEFMYENNVMADLCQSLFCVFFYSPWNICSISIHLGIFAVLVLVLQVLEKIGIGANHNGYPTGAA